MRKKSKYRSVKRDGFHSIKEAKRATTLKLLEKNKYITNLSIQPEFILQEGFRDNSGKYHQPIKYIADFKYYDFDKEKEIVEDVKGFKTEVYRIKKKLFLKKYPQYLFVET